MRLAITGASKWAVEPDFEMGRFVASPRAKIRSCPSTLSVCLSVGSQPPASPNLESITTCAPLCGGTSTKRSYSCFSPSSDSTTPAEGSTASTLKNVVSPIPLCSMIGWISSDALSIVNARLSGESRSTSLVSRRPRSRRNPSTMNVNSTGAGGHLYGMPATPTLILPPVKRCSSCESRSAPASE